MAGKPKHGYQIRQKPKNTWEILAINSDGEEFWYGDFTMKQNAVRWGDSHKIEGRFPQVVERFDDPFGIGTGSSPSKAIPIDPVDRAFQQLCKTVGVDQTSLYEVVSFTEQSPEFFVQVHDPKTDTTIWQILG